MPALQSLARASSSSATSSASAASSSAASSSAASSSAAASDPGAHLRKTAAPEPDYVPTAPLLENGKQRSALFGRYPTRTKLNYTARRTKPDRSASWRHDPVGEHPTSLV